jgi:hypothetical protein
MRLVALLLFASSLVVCVSVSGCTNCGNSSSSSVIEPLPANPPADNKARGDDRHRFRPVGLPPDSGLK